VSSFRDSSNNALSLILKIVHPQSGENPEETVLHRQEVTDIYTDRAMIFPLGSSQGIGNYNRPLAIKFAKASDDDNFARFGTCLVTLRFKKKLLVTPGTTKGDDDARVS